MEDTQNHRNPDFIGVGGEKTASTWIYTCLREHPEICGPREKELSYFDTVKLIGHPHKEKSRYETEGLFPYLAYFESCKSAPIVGEYTVTYLHQKNVAPLIASLFPEVKILISLRNPIDRSFSQYQGIREEDRAQYGTFENALKKEPEFIRRSMYAEYLEPYFTHFKKERILIVLHDDVVRDPQGTLRTIYTFLGVDNTFLPPSALRKERSAEQKKLQTLRDRAYGHTLTRTIALFFRRIGIMETCKKILLSTLKKEAMKPETRLLLYGIFKEDIEKTGKLIQRDLNHWH